MPKKINVDEEAKLRWPDGWERTRVNSWQSRKQWSKSRDHYRAALIDELSRMGAESILITRSDNERTDPGVSVWFSKAKSTQEWQDALGLENPAPTLAEINKAFQDRAIKNHPDHGGDIQIYQRLVAAREAAKEWIAGTHQKNHDFVMALDLYKEVRWNMAGLGLAIKNLRSLERLGMPSILERTLNKAFKAALPMQAGGAS